MGQVYVPQVNWALMVSTIVIVIGFGSSSALAAAYGIAVTLTMVITAVLLHVVAIERWHWPPAVALARDRRRSCSIDLAFFGANVLKIAHGGWLPLVIGVVHLHADDDVEDRPADRGGAADGAGDPARGVHRRASRSIRPRACRGTAVFMTAQPNGTPAALAHNLRYNKVLHEHVVILMVMTRPVPHVPDDERCTVRDLGAGVFELTAALRLHGGSGRARRARCGAREHGLTIDEDDVTFFLGRETLIATQHAGHGAVARAAVRADGAQRRPRDGVLPPAAGARRRARRAGRDCSHGSRSASATDHTDHTDPKKQSSSV